MWHNYRSLNRVSITLVCFAVFCGMYAVIQSCLNSDFFSIREINFRGDIEHVSEYQFSDVVTNKVNGGFFNLDLTQAKQSFEQIPWVKTVAITRVWPDTLNVEVVERTELARWAGGGLVDDRGELFLGNVHHPLPTISGPLGTHEKMVDTYQKLSRSLEPFDVTLDKLTLSKSGSWKARLSNGIDVAMGEQENIQARMGRFMRFLPDAQSELQLPIRYVDLRYSNGFAVSSEINTQVGRKQ